jgi:serine/threonine protein kinase
MMPTEAGGASTDTERDTSGAHATPPLVQKFQDFTSIVEHFDVDEKGEETSKCTKFVLVDKHTHAAWTGTLQMPKREITLEKARACLRRISDAVIYPAVTDDLVSSTLAASKYESLSTRRVWLKRPNITIYDQVEGAPTNVIADELMKEIRSYQLLQQHPHANIAEFLGCLEKDGRIVGILLKRYQATLSIRMTGYNQPTLDISSCIEGIVAGMEHLHSLGLAHNDLNPENIMFEENLNLRDRPTIVDMGSCSKFGEELNQRGTPGWNEGFESVSSKKNDSIGMSKVKEWAIAEFVQQSVR